MNKSVVAQGGLTLVEVLVAMAILGIILVLITNWQTQTLQLTTKTSSMAEQLTELNELSGYVGDRIRSAVRVRVATSGLDVNSGAGNTCSNTTPCLALVIPEFGAAGTLPKYLLYVYRMQARSVVTDDKATDVWAETNVQVLREFRSTSTSAPTNCILSAGETLETATSPGCSPMRNLATLASVSNFQPYLVADYLTPSDTLGSGVAPFTWTATSRTATLAFQSRKSVRGVTTLVPTAPYTLDVQARNVP